MTLNLHQLSEGDRGETDDYGYQGRNMIGREVSFNQNVGAILFIELWEWFYNYI